MFNFQRRRSRWGYWGMLLLGMIGGAAAWEYLGPRVKRKVESSRKLASLKREVSERASRIKDISQEQYNRIVDEAGDRYGRLKSISQNELQDLLADLKKHWHKMKDAWSKPDSGQDQPLLT